MTRERRMKVMLDQNHKTVLQNGVHVLYDSPDGQLMSYQNHKMIVDELQKKILTLEGKKRR